MNVFFQYVLPSILGLTAGIIGTIVAPWVQWGIEKRKIRLNRKIELLQDVKLWLNNSPSDYYDFVSSTEYLRIRQYLSKKLRDRMELTTSNQNIEDINVYDDDKDNPFSTNYHKYVLKELEDLEEKWGLI